MLLLTIPVFPLPGYVTNDVTRALQIYPIYPGKSLSNVPGGRPRILGKVPGSKGIWIYLPLWKIATIIKIRKERKIIYAKNKKPATGWWRWLPNSSTPQPSKGFYLSVLPILQLRARLGDLYTPLRPHTHNWVEIYPRSSEPRSLTWQKIPPKGHLLLIGHRTQLQTANPLRLGSRSYLTDTKDVKPTIYSL